MLDALRWLDWALEDFIVEQQISFVRRECPPVDRGISRSPLTSRELSRHRPRTERITVSLSKSLLVPPYKTADDPMGPRLWLREFQGSWGGSPAPTLP